MRRIGVGQAVDAMSIYLAPQSMEIVETVVFLIDDDNVVERVHGRGVVRLQDRRRSDYGGKSEYRCSNVHYEPPRILRQ
jgi:hypothetical protein